VIRVSRILEFNRLKPRIFSRRLVEMAMNAYITHKKSLIKNPVIPRYYKSAARKEK
jgi:hypothetical protein